MNIEKSFPKHYQFFGIPIGLFVINFCIKFFFIQFASLSLDEPFSVYYALYSVPEIVEKLIQGNNPPIYEIFLHYWTRVFGISELSVRLPSLIFSSISVCVLYDTVKSHMNWKIGIVTALFFIFSSYHIEVAQEARSYALFGLFILLSTKLFLSFFTSNSQSRNYLLWSINSILMIYTHYLGWIVLGTQLILVLVLKKEIIKTLSLYVLYILVAFIPIFPFFFRRFVKTSIEGTWVNAPRGLEDLYFTLVAFTNKPVTAVLCIVLLLGGVFIFKKLNKKEKSFYLIQVFLFLIPFIGLFIVSYFIPIYIPKYLIFLTFPLYILLAIHANYLSKDKRIKTLSLTLLLSFFIFSCEYKRDSQRPNKELASYILKNTNSSTKVVISPTYYLYSFVYYYDIEIFKKRTLQNSYSFITGELEKSNITSMNEWNHKITKEFSKIVFLDADADFSFPKNGILASLRRHFSDCDTKHFGPNIRVHICN